MNSTELLAVFREELSDAVAPYLWSDVAFYRYLDDAQKMFCRMTEGIEDSRTAAVVSIPVVISTEWYAISKLILKVRSATLASTGADIPLINIEKAPARGIRFNGTVGPLKALVAAG